MRTDRRDRVCYNISHRMSITVCHSSYSVTTSLVIVTRSVDDSVTVMVMTGIADYLIVIVMHILTL
jgi:hypothetical protein